MEIRGMIMFRLGQRVKVFEHDERGVKGRTFTVTHVNPDGSTDLKVENEIIYIWPEQCRPV